MPTKWFTRKRRQRPGLIVFVASGYYPQTEISIVPFQVNVGLNYQGLFPGRDRDHTMLHFIYGDLSRDYALARRVTGGHLADSEKVIESLIDFSSRGGVTSNRTSNMLSIRAGRETFLTRW
jgi:hypothetical protein